MSQRRRYVIDASMLIKSLLPEAETPFVRQFLSDLAAEEGSAVYVPDLIYIECANVLWKKVQRGEVDINTAERNQAELLAMDLYNTPLPELAARAVRLACDYKISAYDASYLALAERLGVPLLTADVRLVNLLVHSAHKVITLASLIPPVQGVSGN
jgi:predicted nucleic acid-binding protein